MASTPSDEPDSFTDVFNFGKFRRSLRNDDLINPVTDLNEKAEQLRKSVTITETDDEYYSAQGEERGVCLILENDEFHPSLEDLKPRGGSEVDRKLIENSFK